MLLFWSTLFPGAENSSSISVSFYLLSLYFVSLDSSPPPLAPFEHRIVTPKPHQIATYYTINRDEVLGGWVKRVPVCHKFVFFLSCLTSAPFIADLTPWEGAPNYFFSKTFSLPTKGQMTLSLGGHLQNSPCDVIHRCEILPLKVRLPLNTQAHFSDLWHKNGPER